MTPFMTTILIF